MAASSRGVRCGGGPGAAPEAAAEAPGEVAAEAAAPRAGTCADEDEGVDGVDGDDKEASNSVAWPMRWVGRRADAAGARRRDRAR